jgi:DNA gyrase inhibitor GyrI
MSELKVRIVRLEPMRVASVHALSASPEQDAWDKLVSWAKPRGLFDDVETHRIFGFDNPSPSSGSPNYGYEFWIKVGPDVEAEGEVKIHEFLGGLYAVARCKGTGNITETWKQLVAWCEASQYKFGHHQALEANVSPVDPPPPPEELVLDLHCPIVEKNDS